MPGADLESLSREELIKIIRMLAKDWLTVDGLWFRNVEEKYGMDVAMELDVKMWWRNAEIEARRIKETLNIRDKGIDAVTKVLDYMAWALAYPFEYEERTSNRVVAVARHCLPQEARARQSIGEFPCKPTGHACLTRVIEAVDPRVKYRCLVCPPDKHPAEYWCKWELSMESRQ